MIVVEQNVMVPMTDGVRLATHVFRLQEAPPAPVLLVRTPYGKDQMIIGGSDSFDSLRAIQAGPCRPGRARSLTLRRDPRANVHETSDRVYLILVQPSIHLV
jgi:hypothetical protein